MTDMQHVLLPFVPKAAVPLGYGILVTPRGWKAAKTASEVPETIRVFRLIWQMLLIRYDWAGSAKTASSPSMWALSSSTASKSSVCHSCRVLVAVPRPDIIMNGVSVGEML